MPPREQALFVSANHARDEAAGGGDRGSTAGEAPSDRSTMRAAPATETT
jgi:hypothetical protein